MKEALKHLFLFAFILALCGCADNKLLDLKEGTVVSQDHIITTEKNVYPTDVKKIRFTIAYLGNDEGGYGSVIGLHKKENGVWRQVPFNKDAYFTYEAVILSHNESHTLELNLETYFDLPLDAGEYRIFEGEGYINVSNTFKITE